jgi:hypothetical protein
MSTLDDLDQAVVESAPSPSQARRTADAADPQAIKAERQSRWEALIPEGVTGKMRADLESALDLAHFAMGWPVNQLAQQMVEISTEVAQAQGMEPDDPKVGRATALRMTRTINQAALSQNPFSDASPDLERYINKTSAYARTLGWSPQQIGLTLKSALVEAQGDKTLAAGLFASHVMDEAQERGHRGSVSLENLPGYSERGTGLAASEDVAREDYTGADLEDDRTAQISAEVGSEVGSEPANDPYAPERLVTVYEARDDNNTVNAFVMRADSLRAEVEEREVMGRIADAKLAIVDKVAASVLKPVDYAVYRVMRDEAYRIGSNADVDLTLTKVVQEKLRYEKLQGADAALKRVQKQLAEYGLKDVGELSEQAKQRLAMSTEQAIAAGVAAGVRRNKEAVLE